MSSCRSPVGRTSDRPGAYRATRCSSSSQPREASIAIRSSTPEPTAGRRSVTRVTYPDRSSAAVSIPPSTALDSGAFAAKCKGSKARGVRADVGFPPRLDDEDGRAAELPGAESRECVVRRREGERLHLGSHRHLRREREELLAVPTREVG